MHARCGPADLELINELMSLCTSAIPLNPAHKLALAAMGMEDSGECHIKLGETLCVVDTEHARLDADVAAQARVEDAIKRTIASTRRSSSAVSVLEDSVPN